MTSLSPQVQRLHEQFRRRYAELGTRLFVEPEDAAAYGRILLRAWERSVGHPAVLRRALGLEAFAREFPVRVEPHELLVGRQTFNPPSSSPDYPGQALAALGYAGTTGHIVHDYETLLRHGVDGLLEEVSSARPRATTPDELNFLKAVELALTAFSAFIVRHAEAAGDVTAENLRHISRRPPATFHQALQLVWFAQIFLHAENPSMAISFGRLDQALWPFLRDDLSAGRLSESEAFDLVCAFCLKCCEGEESQNLTVGGVDARGKPAANPLSVMFLRAVAALQCHQPSLTVRWRDSGDDELKQAACELAATGCGQPGFMNDTVVTEALQAVRVPLERARDWGIVGCYEAAPQGDCYANTVLGALHLPAALAAYLEVAAVAPTTDFDGFAAGFHEHLARVYGEELARLQRAWSRLRDHAPSPFGSALMGGCLESLRPLEAGGARFNLVGINIQGLGTLVDSLHAIRTLVYERGELTLGDLAQAAREDFPDEALRSRLGALPGRYGTDNPATNALAAELSEGIARMVLDSRLEGGVRPYPAFFRFSGDIYDLRVASADGRHADDLISYGAGPSTGTVGAPTAAMRSAAHVAHRLCACGNPLAISLPHPLPPGEQTAELIRSLTDTYFGLGGMHVHYNLPAAGDLRAAQERPEEYGDLLIRVSGFSARFVRLDRRWQDALIERA